MPTPRATENWSAYRIARGKDATRAWLVTDVTNSTQAIATAGISEGATHPEDARLKIPLGGIAADKTKGPTTWTVTANYSTNQITGNGGDPLDEYPIIFPQPIGEEHPVDADVHGNPYTNSAYIPFSGLTRRTGRLLITIQRNESTYNLARTLDYQDKLNLNSVVIARVGTLLPRQLLCLSIHVADGFPTNADYVKVVTQLEARPYRTVTVDGGGTQQISGFKRRLPDIGREAFFKKAGNDDELFKGNILHREGANAREQVSQPVFLDGRGGVKDTIGYVAGEIGAVPGQGIALVNVIVEKTPYGTFLWSDDYDEIDYSGLSLPAS